MKRRNFLINSAAAFGGCTFFSGCKDELIKKEDSIIRRRFKDIEISLLGFGGSRLPVKNQNEVDMAELDNMIEYAISHGVNFFDTAFFYVDYKSETAIGEILKKYKRESYLLSDKSPVSLIKKKEDIREIFDKQLKKCQVDYFDFYMAHGISVNNYDIYKNTQMHNELLELKKEGKIRYLGFSFHGTLEMLNEIVNEGLWDCCQLQMNYFDWNAIKAKEQYETVKKAKIPVVVMEPLRGGWLINLPQKALDELNSDITPAEFALRWAASLDNVVTVLSGMSNIEQVKQNVKVFENFKVMTKDEKEKAQKIVEIIQLQGGIKCTGCNYCIKSCPRGINISAIFTLFNQYKVLNNKMIFKTNYETLSEKERAHNCIKCGACNKTCTQGLNIPELLEEVDKEYGKILNEYLKSKNLKT